MTAVDAAATIHSLFSQETTDQAAAVVVDAETDHGQTGAADAAAEHHGHQTDVGTDAETATVTVITAGR